MKDSLYGYMGKNLFVDLSERETIKKDMDFEIVRRFIGGNGIYCNLGCFNMEA